MTIISEQQDTVGSLIDDIATEMESLSNWSDADTAVVNDGSDDYDPRKNGRVFSHDGTGTFLFMFATRYGRDYNENDYLTGVRLVTSTDWNTDRHWPAGLTTLSYEENHWVTNYVDFTRRNMFNEVPNYTGGMYEGLWVKDTSETPARDTVCTYFGSVREDGFSIGAWNTDDGSNGIAGYHVWEYVDNKIYDDGDIPLAQVSRTTGGGGSGNDFVLSYGTTRLYNYDNGGVGMIGYDEPIDDADWGRLNPDANDDTFFVKRAPIYRDSIGLNNLVAFIEDAIPNHESEGAAHGDTVSYDGTDYRIMVQSGASKSTPVSVGLRYE